MKNKEWIKEGWVEFTRVYCKEGWIDRWMGDCINDPNNPEIHQLQLNSGTSFYRLNDGKWIHKSSIDEVLFFEWIEIGYDLTAKEIWDEILKDELKHFKITNE